MKRILFVVTAASKWTLKDGTEHPTGYWAEELAEPHRIFSEAGGGTEIATPGGVAPTLDELSLGVAGGLPRRRRDMRSYLEGIQGSLDHPLALVDVNEADFDLVFYPGGHGPMEDLAFDADSGALLERRLGAGRPLALLCHAPAAVLAARSADGTNAFAGRRMTGLSNVEAKWGSGGHWRVGDASAPRIAAKLSRTRDSSPRWETSPYLPARCSETKPCASAQPAFARAWESRSGYPACATRSSTSKTDAEAWRRSSSSPQGWANIRP